MTEGDHFLTVQDWEAAEAYLGFTALKPRQAPSLLRIHVRDHRHREVDPTLETYFDDFVLSQAKREPAEAIRLAERSYGPEPSPVDVCGRPGWVYELGPESEGDDVDPRQPSIVVFADAEIFVLLASDELVSARLFEIARSLH